MQTRKRKLSEEEKQNLGRCLGHYCSDRAAVAIWNIASELRPDACRASASGGKRIAAGVLRASAECVAEISLPAKPDAGPPVTMSVAALPALIQRAAQESLPWADAFRRALLADPAQRVSAVVYLDEVTCGNILAPRQQKKIWVWYLCFKELFPAAMCNESAWLPYTLLQHNEAERVAGGLCRLMAALARQLFASENLAGFPVRFQSGPMWVRLAPVGHMLTDADAQRAAYGIKGSAGLKPCMSCANVVMKGSPAASETCPDITEARRERFMPATDRDRFLAADALSLEPSRAAQKRRSVVLGLNHVAGGLLQDALARAHMPPSSFCVDAFHVYFSNRIACQELGLVVERLRAEGISLDAFRAEACAHEWRYPSHGRSSGPARVSALLATKMFDEKTYRGSARDTIVCVFLLCYYLETKDLPSMRAVWASYVLLTRCVGEIRRLRYQWRRIADPSEVAQLDSLQSEHHRAFLDCYGANAMRPKHHALPHSGSCAPSRVLAQRRVTRVEAPLAERRGLGRQTTGQTQPERAAAKSSAASPS
ncbi:unnamed protein product [Effrenium voratum]|nr:unnamed protein product [Effrenium voratum]